MIVVLGRDCTQRDIDSVVSLVGEMGATGRQIEGTDPPIIEILEADGQLDPARLEREAAVERVVPKATPLLAAGRQRGDSTLTVPLGRRAAVGGRALAVIAGPCSVEDEGRLLETAQHVAARGGGGAAWRGV